MPIEGDAEMNGIYRYPSASCELLGPASAVLSRVARSIFRIDARINSGSSS